MNRRHWRRLAALAVAAAALAGCQQRLSGLAPWSIGGDSAGPSAAGSIVVAPGDTAYAISRRYEVPLRDLIELNKLAPPYTLEPGQRLALPSARQYIVQPGDTLYGVSRMFSVDVSELTRLNNLTPPYAIKTGQPLRLPSPAAGY
ncbi:MAG TPA: LysM peptidoglycan-binding domain-containing protein, partial [Azospirillaceae bacterium]|nr:LysM peptidoglycan-binding domain-containing protein [Azospirillaceae bacterium]